MARLATACYFGFTNMAPQYYDDSFLDTGIWHPQVLERLVLVCQVHVPLGH